MNNSFNVPTGDGERTIHTTVTANPNTVTKWITDVNAMYQSNQTVVFGLDVEWKPNMQPGGRTNPAATLQICIGNFCLIIQLRYISHFPASLCLFLRNPRYVFCGAGVMNDAVKLREDCGLVVENVNDVKEWAVAVWPERLSSQSPGLKELARVVAGTNKLRRVTLSDWGVEELSGEQIRYACLDAYASCVVGVILIFGYDWAPN